MVDKIGAKQFRDPLIKVLCELSGGKAEVAIDHKMVYDPVLQILGVTSEEYGTQGDTGTPWVERWTQWHYYCPRDPCRGGKKSSFRYNIVEGGEASKNHRQRKWIPLKKM